MRLKSLDVFRGLTVAGMIFVNMAGLGEIGTAYPWINHATWHGSWNLADYVFPFFLFIIGVAMAFSFAKYTTDNRPAPAVYIHILRRAALLFVIGLLINGIVYSLCKIPTAGIFDLPNLRIMGVLQRISLSYAIAAVIVLWLPQKLQWLLAGGILVLYWLLLSFVVAPNAPADVFTKTVDMRAFFDSPIHNIGSYIDRQLIPAAHFYKGGKKGFEPEGLFSTLPAIVSVLLGYFTGVWLKQRRSASNNNSTTMVMFGLGAIIAGRIWGYIFPINKNLWTSSFVLFMAGWALVVFAICYELIDVRQWGLKFAKPFEVMGMNALFAFIGSVLMIKVTYFNNVNGCGDKATNVYSFLRNALFGWSGEANSAVLFALATVLLWMLICWGMYRQQWLIKL